jgi:hypothetical protein
MTTAIVPITFRALPQRLNRHLATLGAILKKVRERYDKVEFGDWFVLDRRHTTAPRHHGDPVVLAQELGVLHEWETVVEEKEGGLSSL